MGQIGSWKITRQCSNHHAFTMVDLVWEKQWENNGWNLSPLWNHDVTMEFMITRGAAKGRGRGARPGGRAQLWESKLKLGLWFHCKGELWQKIMALCTYILYHVYNIPYYIHIQILYMFTIWYSQSDISLFEGIKSKTAYATLGQPPGGAAVTKSASLPPLPENKVPVVMGSEFRSIYQTWGQHTTKNNEEIELHNTWSCCLIMNYELWICYENSSQKHE